MPDARLFTPEYSTDSIWYDDDMTICLTDVLIDMQDDIAGKADTSHTHSEYAIASHTHDGYATATHSHTEYANVDHTHTGYAADTHVHSQYALATDVDALESKVGDSTVAAQISSAVATKADANHTHTEYANVSHEHSGYALSDHTHTGYAAENHEHTNYAALTHSHTEYAGVDHTHSDYALTTHSHDGYASTTDVAALQTLVGDTSVASQISTAISGKADVSHTHTINNITGLESELDSKYEKASTGIPKADLASDVQTSLGKADTAVQSLAGYATESYVDAKVAGVVDSSPETLNTLNELAAALGDDPNFATTVATQIGNKVDKIDGKDLSSNDYTDAEKTKLASIETGANCITVDAALNNTSTNPVQNKVVNSAISGLSTLVGDIPVSQQIGAAIATKADSNHTHNYAGSASAGGAATSANKLNTNAGSATQPVYFSNGIPVATTYTLGKSVPSNAVFTDTTALGSMTGTLPVSKGGTGATTAADARAAIGALAKSGDTMTGNLTVFTSGTPSLVLRASDNSSGDQALSRVYKNASATVDYGLQLRDYAHGGNETNTSSLLMICDKQANLADKLQFVRQTNGTNAYYKLYGEHNKPAPSDIGAAASNHTHSAATTSTAGFMSAADKTKLNTIASFNLTKELSTITITGQCVKVQGLFMLTVKLVTTTNIPQWTKLFSVASAGTMSRDDQRGHKDTNGVVGIQARNNTEAGTGLWFQSSTAIPAGTYYFDMILM